MAYPSQGVFGPARVPVGREPALAQKEPRVRLEELAQAVEQVRIARAPRVPPLPPARSVGVARVPVGHDPRKPSECQLLRQVEQLGPSKRELDDQLYQLESQVGRIQLAVGARVLVKPELAFLDRLASLEQQVEQLQTPRPATGARVPVGHG